MPPPRMSDDLKQEIVELTHMAKSTVILRFCSSSAGFISTAVVGKLGSEELAAAAYSWAVISLTQTVIVNGVRSVQYRAKPVHAPITEPVKQPKKVGGGMATLVAQVNGATRGQGSLASVWLQTALVVALALSPAAICFAPRSA